MEEKRADDDQVEEVESDSSDSFIDDELVDDDTKGSLSKKNEEELHFQEPMTEEEVEELIAEFLEVESKAAEAQETLEKESLTKVEKEVREELAQTLQGDDLENAVADEMLTFKEEWEGVLDELETESTHLLEQLDGAGIALPSLYKWIESQAPNGCCTEAWKRRTHWVGSQVSTDITELVTDADRYLQAHRPVRRKHGKLLEEGASGFLQKKLAHDSNKEDLVEDPEIDWSLFNKIISGSSSANTTKTFGSTEWASVYLASTPQQAAAMGLKFPGADEVEEIEDIDGNSGDPFVADAIENERGLDLSEDLKRNFKKVKEEDDARLDWNLQLHLKRRRHKKRSKQDAMTKEALFDQGVDENVHRTLAFANSSGINLSDKRCGSDGIPNENIRLETKPSRLDGPSLVLSESSMPHSPRTRGLKRLSDYEEPGGDNKKSRVVVLDSDDDTCPEENEATTFIETGTDSVGRNLLPSPSLNDKFHCTACSSVIVHVHHHPLLEVIVCRDCKYLLKAKMHLKDPDCSMCYCGWCGGVSDLIKCSFCKTLFCSACIKRNIGEECLSEVQMSGWKCCCCRPEVLKQLTIELEKAMNSRSLTVSSSSLSSDSDSGSSDAANKAGLSSNRREKKRIRRILDDAELGEETKRKLAIEKERQERLKSLQEQFSSRSKTVSSSSFIGNISEGATVEVFGEAIKGYIVNVVREKGEEAVRIPPSISAKLKVHQIAGIHFMWENIVQSIREVKSGDKGLGCILAHTMGLGKTFQVIAFLYTAMRSVDLGLRTALIVTPVNVLHNWRHEFLKWRPSELKPLRVFMLEDVSRDRRAELLAKWRAKGGIFLIGYSSFRNLSLGKNTRDLPMSREISRALHEGPDIFVCDEAHTIKNTRADVTQALKQVKCQRRIALTGSPLQNNLMEYYCMVDFVREGFLGSSHEFRNRFQNPIENGQHANSTIEDVKIMNQRSHILYEQLKGFVQRMDMNVAKKDLPPKTVFVIAVKLSPLQRKLYKKFLDMHGFTKDNESSEKIRKSFFAGYQALAQIWNHPGILQLRKEDKDSARREEAIENFLADDCSSDENIEDNLVNGEKLKNKDELPPGKSSNGVLKQDWWKDLLEENNFKDVEYSGKMVLLLDILKICSDVGDKALVFSQSIPTLDLIESYLSKLTRPEKKWKSWKKGEDWYRLDGKTEASERQKLVERFNEPYNRRVKCALISTRAGSLGINLYAANRVIIVDGSWNPTYDLQAIYRAWRYGQTKPVFAYRFVAHGTMEEKIYKRQVIKEGLAARVVDRQQVHRTMSKEEMLHLFEFGDDENPDSLLKLGEKNGQTSNHNSLTGDLLRQKSAPANGSCSSDKIMETLLGSHSPRWIANYHEHETLLQENEEEKLSKEEQDMAWETYKKTLEWEEVRNRAPLDEISVERKATTSNNTNSTAAEESLERCRNRIRNRTVYRQCTNLSHLLTLRSQGIKVGCGTVCGECAKEISWEDFGNTAK